MAKIPQVDVKLELDEPPPREEIKKATMQLKVGTSPDINGIPAEVYQHKGDAVLDKLQDLFTNCWEKGTLPQDLRDAVMFKLPRHHHTLHCRQNLGLRLAEQAQPNNSTGKTPESQCGFRSNRGTTDMIVMLRQIQEKCKEQTMDLCAAFVDLTKAFDTDSRDGLWKILARLGCPPKFFTILRQLHEGQQGQVKHNGSLSGSFPISNGVKPVSYTHLTLPTRRTV